MRQTGPDFDDPRTAQAAPSRRLRAQSAVTECCNGETAVFVLNEMGHSSIKVTFDPCGHLFPGRGKEASDRYEKAVGAARTNLKRMVAKR